MVHYPAGSSHQKMCILYSHKGMDMVSMVVASRSLSGGPIKSEIELKSKIYKRLTLVLSVN